jgi:hypothetical protein
MYEKLPGYQQRVIDEKIALDTKINLLKSFLLSIVFYDLSNDEKELLLEQLEVMTMYSNILALRIEKFK